MHRRIASLIVAAFSVIGAFAQQEADGRLDCGRALMIVASEPYLIYVDGVERGTAPLLLWDLAPGKSVIEARYEGRSVSATVQVSLGNPAIGSWTPAFPEPEASFTFGYADESLKGDEGPGTVIVSLRGAESGASLTVDGSTATAGTPLTLSPGAHVVMAVAPGMLPAYSMITVRPGDRLDLPISFDPDPLAAARSGRAFRIARIAGGIAGSIAGIILATDAVAVPVSGGSYDSYKTIKYSGYGAFGAGLLFVAISAKPSR